MRKNKAPIIPITKNTAQPKPQEPTIVDWVNEAHSRLRKMNADQVFMGDLFDRLVSEIVKRDQIIAEQSPAP